MGRRERSAARRSTVLAAALVTAHAFGQIPESEQPQGLMRWLDPSTAPFIPVPEIDVDPYGGTTLGLIPTWLITDDQAQIRKIIAPDVLYNPHFGVGARGRMYSFDSDDSQWSIVGGLKQRVEREFDVEDVEGRLRDRPWSATTSVIYDRSGIPRFYGIGNDSRSSAETNFTFEQAYAQTSLGWNLSHEWQISYSLRVRRVDVQAGTLADIPSIGTRFSTLDGLGAAHESFNRLAVTYDSRDDTTVPTRGAEYVLYAGAAARNGLVGTSLYEAVGIDARQLWTPSPGSTLAVHGTLRYMPGRTDVPFWSLSNLGGDQSILGDAQPLRGFGTGRFYDRNAFSASVEYRERVLSMDAIGTHVNIELTPFVDVGQVYAHSRSVPFEHLHRVAGLGFRGIASPFVVGYVDIGYGSEGVAVFTGINYPF